MTVPVKRNYKVREAAELLGYSYPTIYKMIAEGVLTCIRRRGHDIRVPHYAIEEYEERFLCPANQETELNQSSLQSQAVINGTYGGPQLIAERQKSQVRGLKLAMKASSHLWP